MDIPSRIDNVVCGCGDIDFLDVPPHDCPSPPTIKIEPLDWAIQEWHFIASQLPSTKPEDIIIDFTNQKVWEFPAVTFSDLPPIQNEDWSTFAEPIPLPNDFEFIEQEEEFPECPSTYAPFWEEKLRELAYFKWEAAGCPNDMADQFWFEAKSELKSFCKNL